LHNSAPPDHPLYSLLSSHAYLHHRALHSFPTRRSSDLPFSFANAEGKPAGYSVDLCALVAAGVGKQLGLPELQLKWVKVSVENRSEEHTSELQSLRHLVCRLLLEKKKKKNMTKKMHTTL